MRRFIIMRSLMLIPVMLGVAFVIYFILALTPGDPALLVAGTDATAEQVANVRLQLGLDDPLPKRFIIYVGNMVRGDLGTSYYSTDKVWDVYMSCFPATLALALSAMFVATLISIPIGIISAVKQNSIIDNLGMTLALIGVSMPSFWLGLLLIIAFSLKLGWFPSGGFNGLNSIVLPAITLGTASAALLTRTTRSSMLEALSQDYMRTARAKGVSEKRAIWEHALQNAMIPILTVFGLQFIAIMGGAILTETVFSWPGAGRLIVDSINRRDLPVIMGSVILTTLFVSIINLVVDVVYAYVDPRIKAQYVK